LVASREDGSPLAILFGYACHNLTLPSAFTEFPRRLRRRRPSDPSKNATPE
jgi:hypothetical protein